VRNAHASTLGHGYGKSRCATFDCVLRSFTSFGSCPRLRLLDEPAQLVEEDAGGCALALEGLDPVEPGQYCAGFVHVNDASWRKRASLHRKGAFLDSGNACVP
jgi:hypothetical protein